MGFIDEGPEVPSEDGNLALLLSIGVTVVTVSSVFKMEETNIVGQTGKSGLYLISDQILPMKRRMRQYS